MINEHRKEIYQNKRLYFSKKFVISNVIMMKGPKILLAITRVRCIWGSLYRENF